MYKVSRRKYRRKSLCFCIMQRLHRIQKPWTIKRKKINKLDFEIKTLWYVKDTFKKMKSHATDFRNICKAHCLIKDLQSEHIKKKPYDYQLSNHMTKNPFLKMISKFEPMLYKRSCAISASNKYMKRLSTL